MVLCSQSPRRRKLFADLGFSFSTASPDILEDSIPGEDPLSYLKRITIEKAISIQKKNKFKPESLYISSDTIVVLDEKILHKPCDELEALEILTQLSGIQHLVYSGMCMVKESEIIWDYDSTEIQFKPWNTDQILEYIQSSKPFDKAGAYGIQDKDNPVENFFGSYTNVLGFPIRKFLCYSEIWKDYL